MRLNFGSVWMFRPRRSCAWCGMPRMSSGSVAVRRRAMRLRQQWPNLDSSRFPLFRITATGAAESAGELITLAARQSVWMPAGRVSNGLPIELADARPSGFLGRHFAAAHADLRLPPRLTDWSDHHILIAMSRRGEDLPGNLIVGDESFARWQALGRCRRNPQRLPYAGQRHNRWTSPGFIGGRRAAEVWCASRRTAHAGQVCCARRCDRRRCAALV